MAPEMIDSSLALPEGDLWSLGCLAYQLLTAKTLFEAESMWLIFQKVEAFDEISWPQGVCPIASDWVSKLLVKDPSGRLSWQGTHEHQFFQDTNWDIQAIAASAPVEPERNADVAWQSAAQAAVDVADAELVRMSFELGGDVDDAEARELWSRYLLPQERVLRSGVLRKHIFLHPTTERRFLLLFSSAMNAGRLIYIDEKKGTQRGEVCISQETRAEMHSSKADYFDVATPQQNFALEDISGGAQQWVDSINALVARTCGTK